MRLELTIEQRMNLGCLDGEYDSYKEIFETLVDDTSKYDYDTFDMGRDEDGNEIVEMQIWKDVEDDEDDNYFDYDYEFTIILDN